MDLKLSQLILCLSIYSIGCLANDNQLCVSSCLGRPDGKYQSCKNCHVYATCTGGLLMDGWPCPSGTLWDDIKKNCRASSATCDDQQQQQKPNPADFTCKCASDCSGLEDGKYQSCRGCPYFVICRNGQISDDQLCPTYLAWDDNYKKCLFASSTCRGKCQNSYTSYSPNPPTVSLHVTPPTVKPTTEDGKTEDNQQTHGGGKWPTTTRSSPGAVCGCITDCTGKDDGYYPSCLGCDYFAICYKGFFFDPKACPSGTVFLDKMKTCVVGEEFCKKDCYPATSEPNQSEEEESSESSERISGSSEEDDENDSDGDQQEVGQRPNSSEESEGSNEKKPWSGRPWGRGRGHGRGRYRGYGYYKALK